MKIGTHNVGVNHPCFIIAEAGVNHNGRLDLALQLIDAAKEAGADAVKFQTFKSEKVISSKAPKAKYQVDASNPSETQLEMVKKLELSDEDHYKIADYCKKTGVMFLSTPFDFESVDLLERLNVPAYKVGSGELTNLPFLKYLASKKKPVILSTGMANLSEVETALNTVVNAGSPVALLHCVSNYPAQPGDVNLRAMTTMERAFQVPIGYSDHTLGIEISLAARALGACIIEKHFTLDTSLPGPDHKASLTPKELKDLVMGVRHIEAAFGDGIKRPAASEMEIASVARRSIVASRSIPQGAIIEESMLELRRPGTGLPPTYIPHLTGRITKRLIDSDEILSLDMFQ